ncbi:hypothetical protein EKD04_025195 [Chloroflexales bacterium ZM16-3]|nr:hypothetical protein [Chloroflexales bacterium ZM16-3]
MRLALLFDEALACAERRAAHSPTRRGASVWVPLPRGATFAVRADATRIQVVLARQGVPVGFPVEEATFCRWFRVPATAARRDHGRTRDGWFKVSFTWARSDRGEGESHDHDSAEGER